MSNVSSRTDCYFKYFLQTNGFLINQEWIDFFKDSNINVGVSIDGPALIHNKNRKTLAGKDTFEKVFDSIKLLKKNKLDFGVLAVADLDSQPKDILDFFINEAKILKFDILVPDFTHEDEYRSISNYYVSLFDLWWSQYAGKGVVIRFFKNIIASLLGQSSGSEIIGYGPMSVITIDTNGDIGPTDTIRITGNLNCSTNMSIFNSDFFEIRNNEKFRWIIKESLQLPKKCLSCSYCFICGGGYLPHKWSSKTKDFQNPSIYCEDLKKIIKHIEAYLKKDIYYKKKEG